MQAVDWVQLLATSDQSPCYRVHGRPKWGQRRREHRAACRSPKARSTYYIYVYRDIYYAYMHIYELLSGLVKQKNNIYFCLFGACGSWPPCADMKSGRSVPPRAQTASWMMQSRMTVRRSKRTTKPRTTFSS